MSNLSDFVVEKYPGAVTPVTHQYAGDVQKKHISLADARHKFRRGLRKPPSLEEVMRATSPIDTADTLAGRKFTVERSPCRDE
jgi:hypothetical protein